MRCLTILCALVVGLTVWHTPCFSQVPPFISIQLYLEEAGLPVTGSRQLDVRWYTTAVGGLPLHDEVLTASIVDGITTVFLGSVEPFPADLLLNGPFWLGISIDGAAELSPRTMLASVPYAMMTDRARIAQELAPEVSGVVTSINEAAGAIQLEAGPGVKIDRNGRTFLIASTSVVEAGTINARPGEHEFTIQPMTIITTRHVVQATVLSDTVIGVQVASIDVSTNTIRLVTSAPLTAEESIMWTVMQ